MGFDAVLVLPVFFFFGTVLGDTLCTPTSSGYVDTYGGSPLPSAPQICYDSIGRDGKGAII
jgi:hypothetical protein